jgi:hypothetical protein
MLGRQQQQHFIIIIKLPDQASSSICQRKHYNHKALAGERMPWHVNTQDNLVTQ